MSETLPDRILLPRPRMVRPGPGFWTSGAPIERRVEHGRCPAQGYRLSIHASGIRLAAPDQAGLFYGEQTLGQLLRQDARGIPSGEIEDWPDYPVRGVMLDISRDKVPSMETLFSIVDLLAELKVNHLQLYTEHTFAYTRHREVWADASPMTAEEARRLDVYCRQRFMELTPNQNSFGHLEKWLTLPRYRHLAECPDGFAWPWGGRSDGPFSLDPSNPGSLALLEELYDELLPCFESRRFNVGCDETFDLGQGRNRARCETVGRGRVYLEFLKAIHRHVRSRGRTMLYWGDIIMQHPELVEELPTDAVALEWGYEADHPFDEHGAKLRDAGVPWWVCPGTSSWNSLAGRTDNCLANLRAAARAGLEHGASGFLNTDWGDHGHWQFLPVSFLGLAAGAALSWCGSANEQRELAEALDSHVFQDRAGAMGGVVRDLGNAYLRTGLRLHNETALFQVLRYPQRTTAPEGLQPAAVAQTREWIREVASRLGPARMARRDAALIRSELELTVRMMLYTCDRADSLLRDGPQEERREAAMREGLEAMIRDYRRLWLLRNRPGGLADSVRRLEALAQT